MEKIIVLGDSHVRSFAKNKYFIPLFIGPGKETCFIDNKKSGITTQKVLKVMSKFNLEDHFIFTFGEPDCRWWSGQGWHPWKSTNKPILNKSELNESIKRFLNMITIIINEGYKNLYIYNTTPSERTYQNELVIIWNEKVKLFCEENNILFIDISQYTMDGLKIVDHYVADVIHLNEKTTTPILKILNSNSIINFDGTETIDYNYSKIKSAFKYNPKFNCLTYD